MNLKWGGIAILNRVVRKGLTKNMVMKRKPQGGEGMSHVDV